MKGWISAVFTIAAVFTGSAIAQSGGNASPSNVQVFQAAGPNAASIQAAVDQFRLSLGANNGNGPAQPSGRREINWDGGGSTATSPGGTPFDVFLNTRGGRFTTPGTGFVQIPVANLADFFANPSYTGEFSFFSPVRLFSPVGSNVTEAEFFVQAADSFRHRRRPWASYSRTSISPMAADRAESTATDIRARCSNSSMHTAS